MYTQDDLNTLASRVSAATWTLTGISTALFFMRMASRIQESKLNNVWDDLIIILAWALNMCRAGFTQKMIVSEEHIDFKNVPGTGPTAFLYILLANSWSILSIQVPKISIGLLIIRVFNTKRVTKIILLTLPSLLLATGIAVFFSSMFLCIPAAGQWNPFKYPHAKCADRKIHADYALAHAACSAAVDFGFAAYPGFVIWKLKMSRWKKISTTALMGLGFASCVCAIVKIVYLERLGSGLPYITILYRGTVISLWNGIENDVILSAACLPYVPHLLRIGGDQTKKLWSSLHSLKSSRHSSTDSIRNSHESSKQPDQYSISMSSVETKCEDEHKSSV